jgi:hypothetical protein
MTNLGDIRVTLTAITSDFEKRLTSATKSLESVKKEAQAVGVAGAAAMAAFGAVIWKSIDAIDEAHRASMKLAAATAGRGFDTKAIETYAGALQKLTTYDDEATITAAATLARYAKTDDQIMQLLPHVQDLATGLSMDLGGASQIVGHALEGNARALRGMGISMTDAQKAAFAHASQSERLRIVIAALTQNYDGLAAAMAKTGKGAATQFKNAVGELLESLGAIADSPVASFFHTLTIAVSGLTDWFNNLSPQARTLIVWAGELSIALAAVATAIGSIGLVVTPLKVGLSALGTVFTTVGTAGASAFTAVLIPLAALAAGIGGLILLAGALQTAFDAAAGPIVKGMIYADEFLKKGGTRAEAERRIAAMGPMDSDVPKNEGVLADIQATFNKGYEATFGKLEGPLKALFKGIWDQIPGLDALEKQTAKATAAIGDLPEAAAFKIDYGPGAAHLAQQEREHQAMEYMHGVRGTTAPIQANAADYEKWGAQERRRTASDVLRYCGSGGKHRWRLGRCGRRYQQRRHCVRAGWAYRGDR